MYVYTSPVKLIKYESPSIGTGFEGRLSTVLTVPLITIGRVLTSDVISRSISDGFNIDPFVAIILPKIGFGTVPGGAITLPLGELIDPSPFTIDPGGIIPIFAIVSGLITPSVVVGGIESIEIIEPDLVTIDPANDDETEPGFATLMPRGLIIEPSDCTIDATGIDKPFGISPSVVVGGIESIEIIEPDLVVIEPTNNDETEPAIATLTPRGFTIEPSDCTIEPAGTGSSVFVGTVPSVVVFIKGVP